MYKQDLKRLLLRKTIIITVIVRIIQEVHLHIRRLHHLHQIALPVGTLILCPQAIREAVILRQVVQEAVIHHRVEVAAEAILPRVVREVVIHHRVEAEVVLLPEAVAQAAAQAVQEAAAAQAAEDVNFLMLI